MRDQGDILIEPLTRHFEVLPVDIFRGFWNRDIHGCRMIPVLKDVNTDK